MLVHSQGFQYGPMVQQDGTDTMDSVHTYTCIWYMLVPLPRIPIWSHGTAGWVMDSVHTCIWYMLVHSQGILCSPMVQRYGADSGQCTYMYMVHC